MTEASPALAEVSRSKPCANKRRLSSSTRLCASKSVQHLHRVGVVRTWAAPSRAQNSDCPGRMPWRARPFEASATSPLGQRERKQHSKKKFGVALTRLHLRARLRLGCEGQQHVGQLRHHRAVLRRHRPLAERAERLDARRQRAPHTRCEGGAGRVGQEALGFGLVRVRLLVICASSRQPPLSCVQNGALKCKNVAACTRSWRRHR